MTTLNDLTKMAGNMVAEKCYYCKKYEADKDSHYTKTMYKLTGVSELIIARSTRFLKKDIEIPRCNHCHRKHDNFYIYVFIPFFIAFVIFISRYLYYNGGGWDWTFAIIVSIIFSFFCAAFITFIINLLFFKLICGIRLDDDVDNHPSVANLVENGWLTSKPNPHNVSTKDISNQISQKDFYKIYEEKLKQKKEQ